MEQEQLVCVGGPADGDRIWINKDRTSVNVVAVADMLNSYDPSSMTKKEIKTTTYVRKKIRFNDEDLYVLVPYPENIEPGIFNLLKKLIEGYRKPRDRN